jgi:hypothetical protein
MQNILCISDAVYATALRSKHLQRILHLHLLLTPGRKDRAAFSTHYSGRLAVGLTPTGVQRSETRSLARLIPRPDRGHQPTYGCGPPSRCAHLKGGEGLGDVDDEVL